MNPLDDMMSEFQDAVNDYVRRMWTVTEEVSGNGKLFNRAVMKNHPQEIIQTDTKIYQFNLN